MRPENIEMLGWGIALCALSAPKLDVPWFYSLVVGLARLLSTAMEMDLLIPCSQLERDYCVVFRGKAST